MIALGNENRSQHIVYVWDNFVRKAKAKIVAAVAHSAGGDGTCSLIDKRPEEVCLDSIFIDDNYIISIFSFCRHWRACAVWVSPIPSTQFTEVTPPS